MGKPQTWLRKATYSTFAAPWRSGYAAACKAVYTGSIPVGAFEKAPLRRGFLLPQRLSKVKHVPTVYRRSPCYRHGFAPAPPANPVALAITKTVMDTASTAGMTICELAGCDAPLAGLRLDARFCCPSHRAMAHQGKALKVPGRCVYCGADLSSSRRKGCPGCRQCAWRARRRDRSRQTDALVTPLRGIRRVSDATYRNAVGGAR